MFTITHYACEFCLTPYDTPAKAAACETQGFPPPAPWFPLSALMPGFGESGIVYASASDVYIIRGHRTHAWALTGLRGNTSLSHNQDPEGPDLLQWFDPREGFDAFRYGATAAELAVWEEALARYGMREEDCEEGVMERAAEARARLSPPPSP